MCYVLVRFNDDSNAIYDISAGLFSQRKNPLSKQRLIYVFKIDSIDRIFWRNDMSQGADRDLVSVFGILLSNLITDFEN